MPLSPDSSVHRVVVIGAGFGGLNTALLLRKKAARRLFERVEITVIEPNSSMNFKPLMYELVTENAHMKEVCPKYLDLVPPAGRESGLKILRGQVDSIDFVNQVVCISRDGKTDGDSNTKEQWHRRYDCLVIAVGATARRILSVPGLADHTLAFQTLADVVLLKEKLRRSKYDIDLDREVVNVVILGGGYIGVELAFSVVDYLGRGRARVLIVHGGDKGVMPAGYAANRAAVQRSLHDSGIKVLDSCSVLSVEMDSVRVTARSYQGEGGEEEQSLPYDIAINALGTSPTSIIEELSAWSAEESHRCIQDKDNLQSVAKHPNTGQLLTRRTLQLLREEHANVFALGDCACVTHLSATASAANNGGLNNQYVGLPCTAQVAMQQAEVVSHNVLRVLMCKHVSFDERQKKLKNFTFWDLGEMVSLGRFRATCSILGGWISFRGLLGGIFRRVAYAYRMPTWRQMFVALWYMVAVAVQEVRILYHGLRVLIFSTTRLFSHICYRSIA